MKLIEVLKKIDIWIFGLDSTQILKAKQLWGITYLWSCSVNSDTHHEVTVLCQFKRGYHTNLSDHDLSCSCCELGRSVCFFQITAPPPPKEKKTLKHIFNIICSLDLVLKTFSNRLCSLLQLLLINVNWYLKNTLTLMVDLMFSKDRV
jgi:hypothetical protein